MRQNSVYLRQEEYRKGGDCGGGDGDGVGGEE